MPKDKDEVKTNSLDRITYLHGNSGTDDGVIGSIVSWRRNGTHQYPVTRRAFNRFSDRITTLIRSHKVELHPREFGFAVYPITETAATLKATEMFEQIRDSHEPDSHVHQLASAALTLMANHTTAT